jgi:hypothetical protein
VARDAAARQSGVDDKSVKLSADEGAKGSYQPGTITFAAKKGKSIDMAKLRADIQAMRLGKGTRSKVTYLEITATGEVTAKDKELRLDVAGTKERFLLGADPKSKKGEKSALSRLREAVANGEKVTSVTGRVEGWSGTWPSVLKALEAEEKKEPGKRKPPRLFVTDFEVASKKRGPP